MTTPKKKPTAGTTVPTQFRLGAETLAALDRIAARISEETGIPATRTDAVRAAAKLADESQKKSRK